MKIAAALVHACLAALTASVTFAQPAPLVAQDAWVRVTPGSDMGAAYLTLRNISADTVIVTGVQSPAASHAVIHETTIHSGQSRMRPHEQLTIAAGQTVKLAPGGLHIMLHGLTQPLTVGQSVPLLFTLAGGATLRVAAPVRPLNAE